jgi:hypothetical protein
MLICLAGLLLVSFVSLPVNARSLHDVAMAGVFLQRLFSLFFVHILLIMIFRPTYFNSLEKLILILLFIQIPIILIQYFTGLGNDGGEMSQFAVLPDHHSVIAMIAVSALPYLLYKSYNGKTLFIRMMYVMAALFYGYMVFLSETRSVIFGIAVTSVVFLISRFRFNRKSVLIIIAFVVISRLVWSFPVTQKLITETFQANTGLGIDLSTLSRFYIWKGAWGAFLNGSIAEKLFGHGIGLYGTIIYDSVIWEGSKGSLGAHNNFLPETGILGFIFFISYFSVVILFFFRKYGTYFLGSAFGYATLVLVISGIAQETFWFQNAFGYYWVIHTVFMFMVIYKLETV